MLSLANREPCGFRAFFESNHVGPGIHKWVHYFPAYERELGHFCSAEYRRPVKMIELGIQSGGSMRMWRGCFGARLELLVGVDVNEATKAWEAFGPNVKVEIQSQADPKLWTTLRKKYGTFDIILDDGSHQAEHMVASFEAGFRLLRPGGVYLIEDITQENADAVRHILTGGGGDKVGAAADASAAASGSPPTHQRPYDLVSKMQMHNNHAKACCNFTASWAQQQVEWVSMYPMIVAVRKRAASDPVHVAPHKLQAQKRGSSWIPYNLTSLEANAGYHYFKGDNKL